MIRESISPNHAFDKYIYICIKLQYVGDKGYNGYEADPMISALLALCAGNSQITGEFPSQRPVTRSFDVFFHLPE